MPVASDPFQQTDLSQRAPNRLTAQWGVIYPTGSEPSTLVFPTLAQPTARGTYLVLDRRRPINRLLEVTHQGEILWKHDATPSVRFAHLTADGTALYLDDSGYYSVVPGERPELRRRFHSEMEVTCGTVLGDVIAVAEVGGIHLLTLDGRLLRRLPPGGFVDPIDIQLLESGHLLVADHYGRCVLELDEAGRRTRIFGRWRQPERSTDGLSDPRSACRTRDGCTVIADWRASRLVEFDPDGRFARELADDSFGPCFVREMPGGELLVVENGTRRVTTRGRDGAVRWQYGCDRVPRRTLAFPRSAQPLPGDEILICDSFHHRVVVMDAAGDERWTFGDARGPGGDVGLTIPRAAHRADDGTTVISDGINGRVLLVGLDGRVQRELLKVRSADGRLVLRDPHQARLVHDGNLLVVDSDLDRVLLIDADDNVLALWGGPGSELRDPHDAVLLDDGVLIADTENNRLVELDRQGRTRWVQPIHAPRFIDLRPDGTIVVTETDANRIIRIDRTGRVLWTVGPPIDVGRCPAAAPQIRMPRSAVVDARSRLLVADYYNGRVVALTRP